MTVLIYIKKCIVCKRGALVIKYVCFPLKSNLIENKVAYRLLVSNITILKNDTEGNYTKIGSKYPSTSM